MNVMSPCEAQSVGSSVQALSHICSRLLHKTTEQSDSSKVEVVGEKKLLLLPNFDQFKHDTLRNVNGGPSAAARPLSTAVGRFLLKPLGRCVEINTNSVFTGVTFR